jgi:lycopene cyclase domain-containing protein
MMLPASEIGWDTDGGFVGGLLSGIRPAGLSYWDLHGFLLLPTLWLLTAGTPSLLRPEASSKLTRDAAFSFVTFILAIAVAQAFVWDSVGAQIGIWQFNPEKTTGLDFALLPLEEILWLFHHVIKAALWQLKIADFVIARQTSEPAPLPGTVRTGGNLALLAVGISGALVLTSDLDNFKCLGLIAAFFAPVFAIIFNLGERYFVSHWRLFLAGWALPGCWTVAIDCVGQQQGVWYFPPTYLTGVDTISGWLKLDIASVYLVSTFAVTATGAIILAAAEEFTREYRARRAEELGEAIGNRGSAAAAAEAEPGLDQLGAFIFEKAFPGLIPGGGFQVQAAAASELLNQWLRLADNAGSSKEGRDASVGAVAEDDRGRDADGGEF